MGYLLGIDLGGTAIKSALYTEGFDLVAKRQDPTGEHDGPRAVLDRILTAAGHLAALAVPEGSVVAVGLGVPGLIDRVNGVSLFAPNFTGWHDVPIGPWLEERLGLPVVIDNDVRMNLYGEWGFGAGRGFTDLVLLTLGTGLGSGVVSGGRVLRGVSGAAGELGHLNIFRDGRPCACGSTGCLGRYVSARGILATVREKLGRGASSVLAPVADPTDVSAAEVSAAFDAGDVVAQETLLETGETLGFGLVAMINLFNPQRIIIGGGVAAAGERLLAPARAIVEQRALALPRSGCEIVTAQLGPDAGTLGAAAYSARQLAYCGHAVPSWGSATRTPPTSN